MQLNRDELRKKLSREYEGDGHGFLIAEARALIMSGNSRQLEDYHLEAILINHREFKKTLSIKPTGTPF